GVVRVAHGAQPHEAGAHLPRQLVPQQGQGVLLGPHPAEVPDAVAVAAAVAVDTAVGTAPVQVHRVVGAEPGRALVSDQDLLGRNVVHNPSKNQIRPSRPLPGWEGRVLLFTGTRGGGKPPPYAFFWNAKNRWPK